MSGGRDNCVLCWDIRSRKTEPIQTLRDGKDSITSLLVTDSKVITGSLDGSIRTYDLRVGEMVTDTIGESITDIAITKDGQCILAACRDDAVRLVDLEAGLLLNEYTGHKTMDYQVECATLANDSKIVCGSGEGSAVIWDLVNGNITQRLAIGNVVHSLATHPTTQDVIFASHRDIQVWGLPRDDMDY